VFGPVMLNTDVPHSPDSTREVGEAFAESVRVLNYATGGPGLEYAGDVYDLLGCLKVGVQRLPQLFDQLARFLAAELEAGRVRADFGDADASVRDAEAALDRARAAANAVLQHPEQAHDAVTWLGGVPGDGEG
jgi:hypothetical protein